MAEVDTSPRDTMEGPHPETTARRYPVAAEAMRRFSVAIGVTTKDTAVGGDDVYRERSTCSSGKNEEGWSGSFVPPDGGCYGWVVCFASFWTNAMIFGTINTFSVLYVHIVRTYAEPDGDVPMAFKTAWIGSVQIAMMFLLAPFASVVEDMIGLRGTALFGAAIATTGTFVSSYVVTVDMLILTYGFIVGIGYSFIHTPSSVILGHYFERHLGLANGIVQAGSSLAVITLPFTLEGVVEEIGVKHTFKLLAGTIALLGLCALAWMPVYHPEDHWRSLRYWSKFKHVYLNTHIWRHRSYPRWVLALTVSFLGYTVPFVHIVNHATDTIPGVNKIVLVMCLGASSGISRLLSGEIADIPRMSRIVMQQASLLFLGIATICIPLATTFPTLVCVVLVLGITDGCITSLTLPIIYDLLGPHGAPQGIGMQMGICAIPMLTGPPLAALLYDYKGNYDIAFILAGIPPIVGAFIMIFVPRKGHIHIRNSIAPEPEVTYSGVDSRLTATNTLNSKYSAQECKSGGDVGGIADDPSPSKRVSKTTTLSRQSNADDSGPAQIHS